MSETTTPKFTHLHVHTHYSLLDGLAKVDKILDQAKDLGMESLAITDHGVLYGAIEFYIKAKERGIKPIIGCEMYVTPNDLHSKNTTAEDRKRHHLIFNYVDSAFYPHPEICIRDLFFRSRCPVHGSGQGFLLIHRLVGNAGGNRNRPEA